MRKTEKEGRSDVLILYAQIAKELKNNTNFGQITGIKEKLDTTCK